MTELAPQADGRFQHLFTPFRIGSIELRNRVIMPPHSSAIGSLWGSDADAEKAIAYLRSRAEAGVSWTTMPGRLANVLHTGFEPTGMSAETKGWFRLPVYHERVSAYVDAIHSVGAYAAQQLTMIGGHPHGPSARYSSPVSNIAPHVLNLDEIRQFVDEYAWSADKAATAGIDIIELHANHDDLHEWFLSPLTNAREDQYGGSLENRTRFLVEVLTAVRGAIGKEKVFGVRMNMLQEDPHGLDAAAALEIAKVIEGTSLVDYLHLVAGSPWGNPSYIQPMWFPAGGFADISAQFRSELSLPIVHTGRINTPEVAERLIAEGAADVVGMARAHVADGELLVKAREGRTADIRPCIGGNDCINRRYVDGLPFGCAVNPHTSRETEGPWSARRMSAPLTVVGGGPAGMELAALCAEAGAPVTLIERSSTLGGQLRLALGAPDQDQMAAYLDWQVRRLEQLGVDVRLETEVSAADVLALPEDTVVAIATGADSRLPEVPGIDLPVVLDSREVMSGAAEPGKRVLVVVEDDHLAPLLLADRLASRGHEVTMAYSTPNAAVQLGRYIVGSILGRLDEAGVEFRFLEKLEEVTPDGAVLRHIYSQRLRTVGGYDSVVIACGGVSDSALYDEVRTARPNVHVLGDAYAPRRLVFATRQAYALAEELTTVDEAALPTLQLIPAGTR
ncbi:2,4-dienoyl-CoA reductase-like NADH-dependent reductase (Old Yellow Enzyme family) [Nocardioides sp. J9]|uniref:oxidoreductase n=1 Tax=Nocardioides sp. J9 TaxID=935844 RepID=UPI00119F67CD|nr:FAD-dependent oxidoreductase [Nocardioides sp. J9]TWG93626.1 2,4-dienoyl-CoA reductase-like NADH-dependent reductase (Old Yellow Enzyme family) [Nocardioides sp. J9]TWG94800.1 2,4-dienoyl-CoA reductase-like NADH-dependent reductase (Old Yellow Enzyme family) [Nocardioides sp. J9]